MLLLLYTLRLSNLNTCMLERRFSGLAYYTHLTTSFWDLPKYFGFFSQCLCYHFGLNHSSNSAFQAFQGMQISTKLWSSQTDCLEISHCHCHTFEKICLYCYVYSLLFPTHTHTALDHVRAEGCSLQGLAEECAKTGDMKCLLLVVQSLLQCQLVLFRNDVQLNIGKWSNGLVMWCTCS